MLQNMICESIFKILIIKIKIQKQKRNQIYP